MPIQQTYKTGTITVVSGSATVTGSGTFWSAGLVNGGELSFKGFSIPIIAVGSDTSLTLDYPAPAGMAGSGAYSISLGRADAASAIVANRQLADLVDLLRSRVSPFAATILDDLNAAAVRATIGAASISDIPPEITPAAILSKLLTVDTDAAGINATTLKSVTPSDFILSLLDDANASAAQTTLGISNFAKSLIGAADGPAARTALNTVSRDAVDAVGFISADKTAPYFRALADAAIVRLQPYVTVASTANGIYIRIGNLLIQCGSVVATQASEYKSFNWPITFGSLSTTIFINGDYTTGNIEIGAGSLNNSAAGLQTFGAPGNVRVNYIAIGTI